MRLKPALLVRDRLRVFAQQPFSFALSHPFWPPSLVSPSHRSIRDYYETLEAFRDQGVAD